MRVSLSLVRLERQATEDVIQLRLRDIDKFFFVTRGRRLFTEVLAPDGIASGLAQVGLFMGDKNAPDEFGVVFQEAIDTWQATVTKENGGIFGSSPCEDAERSCGVTLFADDVLEKSLLEKGTADECEQTVDGRLDAVLSRWNLVAYGRTRASWRSCPIFERRKKPTVLSTKEEYQIKASHRYCVARNL